MRLVFGFGQEGTRLPFYISHVDMDLEPPVVILPDKGEGLPENKANQRDEHRQEMEWRNSGMLMMLREARKRHIGSQRALRPPSDEYQCIPQ